jgi:ribose transport system permease protein
MNVLLRPKMFNVRQSREDASTTGQTALGRLSDRAGPFWTLGVLLLILIGLGLANRNFFSRASWLATSVYATEVLIVALGQTFVMITAGIDLSLGAALGFSAMSAAWVMEHAMAAEFNTPTVMLIGAAVALAVGIIIGMLNGVLITRLRLAPFIATLGTLGLTSGGTLLINSGREIDQIPARWSDLGNSVIAGWFPFPVIVAGVLCVVTGLVLQQTMFGRHVYAIGSNVEAARRAGINVDATLLAVYTLAGGTAAASGILVMSRFGIAHPSFGANDLLASIAAVVIGGTSLFGGRGTIPGTIIGTAILSVLVTGLVLAGVQPYWQTVAVGAIIILAVYVDQLRGSVRGR